MEETKSRQVIASYERKDFEALRDEHHEWATGNLQEFLAITNRHNRVTLLPNSRLRGSDNLGWLSRAALYVDSVVLEDGLGYLGAMDIGLATEYVRLELPRVLARIRRLAPLVEPGFVEFLPPTAHEKVPRDDLEEVIPRILARKEVEEAIRSHSRVTLYSSGHREVKIGPYGRISITASAGPGESFIQLLPPPGEGTVIPTDKALQDSEYFLAHRSLSQSLVGQLALDQRLARLTGSSYLSSPGVEWDLVTLDNKLAGRTPGAKALSAIFDMDLPYLEGFSPEQALEVRAQCPESFENFRANLRSTMSEVSALPGTREFAVEANEIRAEKIDPLVSQLQADASVLRSKVRKNLAIDAPVFIGTSALAIFSPSLLQSVAGALIGSLTLVDLVRTIRESFIQKEDLKANPYHFIFRLSQL